LRYKVGACSEKILIRIWTAFKNYCISCESLEEPWLL